MMSEPEVVVLMSTSKSERDWNTNCDKVKEECNGYPEFWFAAIIMSGKLNETRMKYGW